ncbi:uncharacterized protein K452DRAFT_356457 [Aplosporella prunicola CBS 121167]|uniref:Carrier domain-containing protein n=1 Tax=Aplosporella prunicola CBS 121167 TaxID=1176127 RepID=A0A6A6BRF4_9PEZI|nr:uncharacterized protein K452DRAFT_356457 [Aplosporella prunicola CBS 121167]KAF2145151.1 hypothetical protein K452DRAFT_356457 [Aplosporella prunicola CBS 121167]
MELTAFPNLRSTTSRHAATRAAAGETLAELPQIPDEILVISWARLLKAYTGSDDLGFFVDGGAVAVSSAGWHVSKYAVPELGQAALETLTGVFFDAAPAPESLALKLYYNREAGKARIVHSAYLPGEHAQPLAAQLQRCVNETLDTPGPQMDPRLSILNPQPERLNGPSLLHHLVQWTKSPRKVAIDYLGQDTNRRKLRYASFDRITTAWASKIRTYFSSENPHPVVPVLIPQCPELYIAQLAILKAGGAFCPLNLDAPPERVKFILDDVSANLLITTSSLHNKIPPHENVHVLILDEGSQPPELEGRQDFVDPCPEDLAYVMYTSGSTGTPKGVGVSHLAATQSLLAHDCHIPSFSRFLQFAAPTFDVSVFEIFFPLFRGCTLVTCDRTDLLSDLPAMMNKMHVDAAELTPTVAGTLLQTRAAVPKLKLLLTIGEMLSRQVVHEFGGDDKRESILWGMYGPTEAAIHCTLQPSFGSDSKVGNIGIPFDTVSAFVVAPPPEDPSVTTPLEVLPLGFIGELAVGGHQLANGYLNRPEQTGSSFVNHAEFGRLYRTGDKARMLPDGTIECLGRISSGQVKLRGQRVELGEVEQAISRIPSCRSVTASVIGGILVVFCLTRDDTLTPKSIINDSKQWLPAFMVPGDVVLLQELPRLPSGKVDRKGLEAGYKTKQQESKPLEEQQYGDDTDRIICEIVGEALGSRVYLQTNLAAMGLDSLKAIRVASMLRASGYSLGAVEILTSNDVATLKLLIEGQQNDKNSLNSHEGIFDEIKKAALVVPEVHVQESEIEDILGCTPLQAAMLVETTMNPQAYCNWVELEVKKPQSASDIKRWLKELAAQNDILRSGFCSLTDSAYSHAQIIWKELSDEQIVEIDDFERSFELSTPGSMLRPLKFQILTTPTESKILCQIYHPLYDGWSMDLMIDDLNDLIAGNDHKKRPQFREVATYHASLTKDDLEPSLGYWQKQLDNYAYAPLPNFNGKVVSTTGLSSTTRNFTTSVEKLRDRASALKVNAQVFFQAALAYLTSFYLNNSDVTFGTVTSGRTIPVVGIEEIIGPCIATLPLRVDVSHARTVKDILQNIHELNRAMLSHCELPTRDIKKACGIAPGSPLFDILFVWQESLHSNKDSGALIRQVDGADELEFKLTLEFEPRSTGLIAKATYDPSVLPQAQIDALLSQLEQLGEYFQEKPDAELMTSLTCLDDSVLSIGNLRYQHEETTKSPAQVVGIIAETRPDAPAIAFSSEISESSINTQTLTYSELNAKANQLANLLKGHGTKPDELVCVCMEKSVDLYVSILAILKTGAGYVPITPETPLDRIRFILEEANVRTCLTRSDCTADVDSLGNQVVLNVDTLQLEEYSGENLDLTYNGSHAAYAVFTSGSTGSPKGVVVTQENLVSNLAVLSKIYPVSEDSRLLQSCSQAFDVSVFEIFFSWYSGMCLCAGTKDDLFQDMELAIRQMGITHLSFTPTVAALVKPENVPNVKFLVTAGEAVTEQVKRNWAGKGLYQGYGPSETTNICTVKPNVTDEDLINNIGTPFTNTSAFVMDESRDVLIPRGGVGELCFGGDQVFRGYLNMPDLTAKKVIDHPTFGRVYRSGDMGRLCPDGSILFSGRSDDQVKLRGQRIELGEINSCIMDTPSAADCMTMLMGKEGKAQLVSFWVPESISSNDVRALPIEGAISQRIAEIFEHLASKVPAYMLPNGLLPVTAIPMTVQGKADKRKLVALYEQQSKDFLDSISRKTEEAEDSGDWTSMERKIAAVLSKVVKVPIKEIGRQSSFFAYGLDSISAISLSNGLKANAVPKAPVSVVLQNPSVARLARILSQKTSASQERSPAVDLTNIFSQETREQIKVSFDHNAVEVTKILPCSPLQEAMLSSGSTEAATYMNRMLFKVKGDIIRLQKCWMEMSKRHEILRTCFVPTDDSQFAFAQVVLESSEPKWDEIEANEDDIYKQSQRYVEDIISTMAASEEPPLRFATLSASSSKYLLFCCHHALYDGAAMEQLMAEVEQMYAELSLPPVVPYEPFLEQIVQVRSKETDDFWATRLKGLEPTSFPDLTGLSSAMRKEVNDRSIFIEALPFSLSSLESECRRMSCSLLALGQAAWAKILSIYTGESDLCFGNVVSGRTLPIDGLERLVAPCFNTLPVRVDLASKSQNADILTNLQAFNADILPFQLTPLRRIQAQFSKDGSRLFDTLFILQQSAYSLNAEVWSLEEDLGEMDFPLVCELVPNRKDDTLSLMLHFHEAFIPKKDVGTISQTYASALQSCIQNPSAHYLDIVPVSDDLLSISNQKFNTLEPPAGPFMHSAFEQNAAEQPDALALDFQHSDGSRSRWTFNELNQISNQIARALLDHGVSFDDAVPICIPKSPDFYACVLGVLKAGAAFTPIDSNLPVSRKQFMLQELGAKVVLSNETVDTTWVGEVTILSTGKTRDLSTEKPTVSGLMPEHLAYRLYTSGSTGLPKAVSVEHRNPIQTVEASRSIIPWKKDSRLLQFAATTFDMCYYDCFLAWSFGFTLCAAEQSAMLNDIAGTITSMETTLADLTPSVALSLSQSDVPTLEYLYCIGEAMPQELVARWAGKLVNSYGPTEAAFCVTIFPVSNEVKSAVIGKPFPTTSFVVKSRDGSTTMPVFGAGELYISGSQVARGYHANEEMTNSRFIMHDGQRLYKSGDVVRMLGNGTFEFVGRADDQVKIRGLRVELGEISQVLRDAHEAISSVSTQVLRASEESKEQIVAFLAVADLSTIDREAVKSQARKRATEKLPVYMVPNFYIFLDRIPLSAAGKVDKRSLKAIFQDSEEANQEGAQQTDDGHEWTVTESEIRSVLAHMSRSTPESIGLHTTIYQLGLDSISAVQVAASLRKKGFKISAADVLERPTCAELAILLQKADGETKLAPTFDFAAFDAQYRDIITRDLDVDAASIASVKPCTPLQSGMISQFLHSEGHMYFNYMQYKFDGVDIAKLEQAWQLLFDKHEILRSGFAHVNNPQYPFSMVIYNASASKLPLSKLRDAEASTDKIKQWREESKREVLENLQQSAWRLLLVDAADGVRVHLSILHSLYDAQSLRIFLDDVSVICTQGKEPQPPSLDPILGTILSSSGEDEKHQKFWEEKSKDMHINAFPNMTPLRVKNGKTQVVSKTCSGQQSKLESGCREAGITMQAAGQAAWARLLSAYTGEDAATFGVVLSGRTQEGAESVALPCITTVPLPARNNPSNRALLDGMMAFNSSVRKHQFTPLTKIQRWSGHPDEALFDSIFAYQKLSSEDQAQRTWTLVDDEATVDVAVSIELEPINTSELELRITYNTDRVPEEQAVTILDQLDRMLVDLVLHPDSQLDDAFSGNPELLSITPPKEREIKTDVYLLHEFVERSARQNPKKIAFEFATNIENGQVTSRCWTYEQLDAEGNKIANLLIGHGVQPGGLIAVCFDKCPEASFGMLGILKAGCAFVALDPGAPVARKAFITEDSKAAMVLSMTHQSSQFADQLKVPLVNLDEVNYDELSTSTPELSRAVTPQDLSYCLYTSGTTGTPKGCELTHENAVQAMLAFSRLFYPRWDENSRWLQFASFHFDVSVLEQYWTWAEGIRLVSAPRDLIFEDLAAAISALEITHIDLTPSLARILSPEDVPSLTKGVFITGGEALKQEILDAWGHHEVIHNGYGPTEATIGVTMFPRVPENGKPSNIGPQFDNVGSFVFRPKTNIPVLRGAVGELCVSGKLVGKGYLNRPELTDEKFPYLEQFDERIYRTGDLVRILHDGSFDFLGRADDQVKLRGQRLEIGEINSVINQSEAQVMDVATLVLKHPKQQKDQLISFVVTKTTMKKKQKPTVVYDGKEAMQMVQEACRSKLPVYMVPTHFIPLSSMPLSPNNKADAKQLKEFYSNLSPEELADLSVSSEEGGAASSEDEKRVVEVLATMASVDSENISRTSSIFELGLDSISVIGFANALRKSGFKNAQPSIIMKNPVISRLAKALSSKTATSSAEKSSIVAAKQTISATLHQYKASAAHSLGVQREDIESIAPCSSLQQGIISRSLESEKPVYFATFKFELSPDLDLARLQNAWEKVYEAVQILRARFVPTDDGYVQVVLRGQHLPWGVTSVNDQEEIQTYLETRKHKWWLQNRDQLRRPFEIITAIAPGKAILSVHLMHVLYDGASLPMLLQKVRQEYDRDSNIHYGPDFLDVLPYGPLRVSPEAQSFWTNHLSFAESSLMPNLITEPQQSDVTVNVHLEDLQAFESIRRKLEVTHQALVQASWAAVLQKHFAGAVTLGMVVSGRSIDFEGADLTIGPMFNTIPFHLRFEQNERWVQTVRRCHDFNTSAMPYQHTPLRDIMKWCKRAPSQPLFDTLFVFQKELAGRDPGDGIWQLLEDQPEADYPLALEAEHKQDGSIGLTLVAQGHIADHKAAEELLTDLKQALLNLLADHEALVSATVGEIQSSGARKDSAQVNGHSNGYMNGVKGFEWTPAARRLQEEIATLAGVEPTEVDEHTTIFEFGLDSIDAIKLSSRLKKAGIDLPVSQIMRTLTIPKMVKEVTEKESDSTIASRAISLEDQQNKLMEYFRKSGEIDMEKIECALPVTPLQEAMVAEMLSSGFNNYFNHDVLKLGSQVDVDKMKAAWQNVFRSSAILRTSFAQVDDPNLDMSFAQVVNKANDLTIRELSVSSEKDINAILDEIRDSTAKQAGSEGLFQLTLIRSSTDTYLVLSIAHALYDGWSLGLIHHDVKAYYDGQDKTCPSYNGILEDILNASGDEAAAFWKDFLGGAPSSLLAPDNAQTQSSGIEVHRKEHTGSLSLESLRAFCKNQGITLQALGQTCWSFVLASYVGKLDLVFGVVLSGRDNQNAEDVMFPTMNTVAVRSIIHGSKKDMLRYMQENMSTMRQFQHFPLRKAKAMAETRGKSLFDSLFIFQTQPAENSGDSDALYESVGGSSDVEYPVAVEMEAVGDALIWRTACKASVFDQNGTEELLQRADAVLKSIIEHPEDAAVAYGEDGASVCGMPAFKDVSEKTDGIASDTENVNSTAVAPKEWTPLETTIREVLSAVSKIPETEITREVTMFHMGLDSISAIKVSSLLRKKGIKLSVSAMLRAATVEKMAQAASSQQSNGDNDDAAAPALQADEVLASWLSDIDIEALAATAAIPPANIERCLPASAGQVFMLSTWQNTHGALLYPGFEYELGAPVEEARLRAAWNSLVADHPILRTCFLATGRADKPFVQAVLKAPRESFHVVDDASAAAKTAPPRQPFAALFAQRLRAPAKQANAAVTATAAAAVAAMAPPMRPQASSTKSSSGKQASSKAPWRRLKKWISRRVNSSDEPSSGSSSTNKAAAATAAPAPAAPATTEQKQVTTGWILTLKLHHALYDGVSLPFLVQQLERRLNNPSTPTSTTTQPHHAYATFLAHTIAPPPTLIQRTHFWHSYLANTSPARLPRPTTVTPAAGRTSVFRPAVSDVLERRARVLGVSAQALFVAAYARVYAGLVGAATGSEDKDRDVVIGLWLANRANSSANDDAASTRAVPTVNLLPLRVGVTAPLSLREAAARVQRDLVAVGEGANAGVGVWELENGKGGEVDTWVNFLRLPEGESEDGGDAGGEGGVRLRERGRDRGEDKVDADAGAGGVKGWKRVDVPDQGAVTTVQELQANAVRGAYLHSLDIEATVRGGRLDMGVFASEGLMGVEAAEGVVADVVRVLEEGEE